MSDFKFYKERNGILWRCNHKDWYYYNPYYKDWCRVTFPDYDAIPKKYELSQLDKDDEFILHLAGPDKFTNE